MARRTAGTPEARANRSVPGERRARREQRGPKARVRFMAARQAAKNRSREGTGNGAGPPSMVGEAAPFSVRRRRGQGRGVPWARRMRAFRPGGAGALQPQHLPGADAQGDAVLHGVFAVDEYVAVSYTHLTLPTIRLV